MRFVIFPAGAAFLAGVLSLAVMAALVSSIASAAVATSETADGDSADPSSVIAIPAGARQEAGLPSGPVERSETSAVGGIRVHNSIAQNLRDLLAAAQQDGVTLGGWGWRDHQAQIRLRREHCGTSDYAVWDMPSSQCRPPTARPGRSQHEFGLAVDFTCNGRSIAGTICFRWLQARAAEFGFFNLPSEAWHWSTTGR